MDCATCRSILWPPDRPRLLTPETTAALAHRESCEACSDYLAQAPWMLDFLEDLEAEEAPVTLRDRLQRGLRAPGSSGSVDRRSRFIAWGAAALLVVSVPAVLWMAGISSPDPDEGQAFAADYVRRTAAEQQIRSADQAEVAAFIQAELGRAIQPVQRIGYQLLGAEICLLAGRRGVMLDYDAIEGGLSHYIIPTPSPVPSTPPHLVVPEDADAHMPHVVRWTDEFGEHALVGHGDPGELLGFARQASRF